MAAASPVLEALAEWTCRKPFLQPAIAHPMRTLPKITAAFVFAAAGSLQAGPLDPVGLAGQMPGSSWKQVVKEFRRLDTDDDGRVSRDERELYHIQDQAQESLPLKWTTGVNLVWDDQTFTRAEFWRLLATLRSLPPGQQAAARRSWLASRKANRVL